MTNIDVHSSIVDESSVILIRVSWLESLSPSLASAPEQGRALPKSIPERIMANCAGRSSTPSPEPVRGIWAKHRVDRLGSPHLGLSEDHLFRERRRPSFRSSERSDLGARKRAGNRDCDDGVVLHAE